MAKKNKKKHIYTYKERVAAQSAVTEKAKRFNYRLAFTMVGIFVILAGAYALCLYLRFVWATPVLYLFTAAIFLAFFFVNRGFSRTPISADVLPPTWPEEKKAAFIEDDARRKAFGKKIMVILVPLLLIVAIDILLTVVFPIY